ncbi:hypothetical protein SH1V18_11310 [Vallitalea longa]|uniref:receptor protein-tyrosine kinase n=1 Tax=Vallitalea longa TaxID=2936439 RepID=A0A9W6DDD7_9FIRM|nr:glycine rich domain-containing protein [Vallitalea longa]GKX28651.1 hypothetical protein SH1V18_11310 [Vallitalea longa]
MKRYRLLSMILILCLILTNYYNINAFVKGESGNVSPSESVNARGGINWLVYKVSIVDMEGKNQLTGENILDPMDTEIVLGQKYERHFSRKFPSICDYTLFVEDDLTYKSIWTPNANLSEYNPSNNTLLPINTDIKAKKLHRLIRSTSSPGNVFYTNLRNEIKTIDNLELKCKTDKNWWKRIYTNTVDKESKSTQLWNYILGQESNIETRINEYTGTPDKTNSNTNDIKKEDPLEKALKYLDLLLTLYTLDETLRDDLDKLIPNYIYGTNISKKPLLLSIESAIRVSSNELWKDRHYSYMSSTDYLMYMYGAVQGKTVYDDPLDPKSVTANNTKSIFENSYISSYKTLPGITRLTEIFQTQTRNPFSWGMSGIIGGYYSTKKGVPNWNYWNNKTGVMHGLKFTRDEIGFILIGIRSNKKIPSPKLTIKMNASVGSDGKKKYIVPVENDIIGINSYIDITLTQDSIEDWNLLFNNPDVNYDFKLTLTTTQGDISKLNQQAPDINRQIFNISKEDLLSILDSKQAFRYQQDFTTTPIAEEQNIHVDYTAKLEVDYVIDSKKIHKETEIVKDSIDFSRGKKPIPITREFNFTTKVFSEIKQGKPGNETFEAMAGVPTTRNLYFSSGGAEYLVDIAVEFHSGQQSTRNYTSLFHSVPSQNNMPVINNPWNKDEALPEPKARSKTDHMGTTTTEEVVQEKRDYLKYPPIDAKEGSWSRSSVSAPTPRKSIAWDGTFEEETTTTESNTVTDKPYVPAKKDKDGNITRPAQEAVTHEEYRQVWNGMEGIYGDEFRWVQKGHDKTVGGYTETWSQTITYDYLEITDVAVYEISESIVDGMKQITSTDKIKGKIAQGKPSVFYNIDDTNTAEGGRLIYSLETSQRDKVKWDEGNSDNAEDNKTESGNVNEEAIWKKRKETLNSVTVVSDFLILQTTQGDKSVIYFDQTSEPKQTQQDIILPKSSIEEQWDNNPNCGANWEPKELPISGYTGNYKNVKTAHSSRKINNIPTAHDPHNTSVNRPARPSAPLRLTNNSIDIIDDLPNSEYITGESKVFYEKVDPAKGTTVIYPSNYCSDFGKTGLEFKSTYSSNHAKINDIVVHNPVSAQDAMIVSLPDDRDQRTQASLPNDMEIDTSVTEYDRVLVEVPMEPQYETVKVPNPDFKKTKIIKNEGYVPGEYHPRKENIFNYTGSVQTYTAPVDGEYTLEVWGAQGSNGSGGLGGHSYGKVNLTKGEKLYIHTGGTRGYNGGGSGHGHSSQCGGGGTDIRRNGDSLTNRIIVAGGGGGRGDNSSGDSGSGGSGGGTIGGTGGKRCGSPGKGGSQSSGGSGGSKGGSSGSLGIGGSNNYGSGSGGGGGGGGYYGGGAGGNDETRYHDNDDSGGGGGSGYIGGVNSGTTTSGVRSGNGMAKIIQPEGKTGKGKPYIIIPGSKDETIPNPNYHEDKTFEYTGYKQSYTVPVTGLYTLEVWGAEGGQGYDKGPGGKGGYSKGNIELKTDQELYIYVGGKPLNISGEKGNAGGWNGGGKGSSYYGSGAWGGGGGGATDIRVDGNNNSHRVIVAGGGGGGGHKGQKSTSKGGDGGGSVGGTAGGRGATQNSGYGYGTGQNSQSSGHDLGAGGGGYYGGYASTNKDSGGGGGSGYIGGVIDGETKQGIRYGNGKAKISKIGGSTDEDPYITVKGTGEPEFIDKKVLVSGGATTRYEYKLVPRKVENKPVSDGSGNTYNPGKFINIDYGFQVYYPNRGDFYGNGASGIDTTTFVRGKGYTNNMDTTEWTKSKSVTFGFNVIYNNVIYQPMEEIPLEVNKTTYDFYLPLSVREAVSAKIKFKAIANNCDYYDADSYTNRVRTRDKEAKHSAYKPAYIDIVGRIGNLVIEDTGDWRFSNIFKKPIYGKWYIENVVPKVDLSKQQNIMSDKIDIRGVTVSPRNNYLNTYGTVPSHDLNPIRFPLTPSLNNIDAIKRQPQRLGYLTYMDISTLGNYNTLQVIPYYYNLSLTDGTLKPLDIYMNTGTGYRPINMFDIVKPGWDSSNIYPFNYFIDWNGEKERRCVSPLEEETTENVLLDTKQTNYNDEIIVKDSPYGNIYSGTAQVIHLSEKNRTYIGTSRTNGTNRNPGNRIPEIMYSMNGQRWFFEVGLPSSAVTVPHNEILSDTNIIANKNSVIVLALDIKISGEIYNLHYKHPSGNGTVNISGKNYDLNSIPYNVITVYSTNKSSAEDLDTVGTH